MTALERAFLHLANGLVTITGVVYAVMRYLMHPADEWAVVNHPWQPHAQHLHLLAAPLLVFVVGFAWSRHALPKLRNGDAGRSSGLGLMAGFVPMTVSGALIQTAVDPAWRAVWVVVHLAASGLWLTALALHQAARPSIARRSEADDGDGAHAEEAG